MAVTEEERVALALAALREVTDPDGIGEVLAVEEVEPGVVDVRFACTTSAYAGWHWTVSTADLPDQEPTVLEVELLPGDGALLAPPWVPWAERLAEWRRQHPDERHPGEATEDDDAEDETDEDETDEDADLDEDDLAVDDGLDELDDADLEGEESPDEAEQDSVDRSDEDADSEDDASDDDEGDDLDDDDDDDDRVRPALEDRSL